MKNEATIKKTASFKTKLKLKKSVSMPGFLYTICFIALLDFVFGMNGWSIGQFPMADFEYIVYSPSATTIFCVLGLAAVALALGQPAKQKELAPFVTERQVVMKIDFTMLALYAFYFMLLSLFLPYVHTALQLVINDDPFIRGYTLFHNPLIALLNAVGIFFVFYAITLIFYIIGMLYAKSKGIFIALVIIFLIGVNSSTRLFSKMTEWLEAPINFFIFLLIFNAIFIALATVIQRKWEV